MTPDELKAHRTSELKKAVALGVQVSMGKDAAREIVPYWAHDEGLCDEPTIASLARAIGVERFGLTICLGARQPSKSVRSKLDAHLGLSIGGMTDVLSLIEKLQEGER